MATPFVYDKYVTGKDFIGRKEDCKILGNMLSQGEHIVLYEPLKSGKKSLLQQTFFNMKMQGKRFYAAQFTVFNIRTSEEFLLRLGSTALRAFCSTPSEFSDAVSALLSGTHFVFDPKRYADHDEVISTGWELDASDMAAMLRLPHAIAKAHGGHLFLIIEEFQNISLFEDDWELLRALEAAVKEMRQTGDPIPGCTYIFSGSEVNAMKDIFEHHRYFYRSIEHIQLSSVSDREIVEHAVKGFLSGGKVIERELLHGTCQLFRNNLWYINHFLYICDSLSKGYIVESTLLEALDKLVAVHEPRFMSMMNGLTSHQVSLLRAILEGYSKFSTAEVIDKYGLNSSANVKRVKDALMKKEIITFNEKDEPVILDPLFEYWVKKNYFRIK